MVQAAPNAWPGPDVLRHLVTSEGSVRSKSQFLFLPLCAVTGLLHHLTQEDFEGVQKLARFLLEVLCTWHPLRGAQREWPVGEDINNSRGYP